MERHMIETVHTYRGFWHSTGHCGLQIFPGSDGIPVVTLTELPSSEGTSVTNLIETLAAEVLGSISQTALAKHHLSTVSSTIPRLGGR